MFGRLGRAVVHHPIWTIGIWLVASAALLVFAPSIGEITKANQGSFLPKKYESVQAIDTAEKAFGKQAVGVAAIAFTRTDGKPLTEADTAKIAQVAQALQAKRIERVQAVLPGPVAANRSVQIVSAPLTGEGFGDDPKVMQAVRTLRADLRPQLAGTDLTARVGGDIAQFVDNQKSFDQSLQIVGLATVILILTLILLIFRAPLAALLPLVVIGVVLPVSERIIAIAGKVFDFSVSQDLRTLLLIVMYGIGTDYILFLLFRYRERLRAGDDKKTAMIVAVERVGEVIASAAAAVIVAFLVLLLASLGFFGSLGPSLAIGVGVMLVTALTVVPALVSLLGTAVFWPSKAWKRQPKGTVPHRLGTWVGRRPALVAAVSGGVMIVLALGALGFRANYDFAGSFPQNTESARAGDDIRRGFPQGTLAPTEVYLTSTDGQPLDPGEIQAFGARLATAPGVGQVQEPRPSPDGRTARIDLLLRGNPLDNASITLVRDELRPAVHRAEPPGTRAVVGGPTSIYADINSANNRDLGVILPVAVVLIMLILALLLRSLVAPIYLAVAVLLGFAATLGSAVYVFQGLAGEAGVIFQLPIILYLFVLSIGTDYNILMVARLREEAREGNEPRRAAALGVEHAGPAVAAAGLILAGTFAALMLAPVSFLRQMGFSVSTGIVIVAFIMAMFLVPALTALIGHAAWWPGHGDRARNGRRQHRPEAVEYRDPDQYPPILEDTGLDPQDSPSGSRGQG